MSMMRPEIALWGCRLDLHVHMGRLSARNQKLDPQQLVAAAIRCGLQGIVISEHDWMWPAQEIDALNRLSDQVRIFRGIEVSSRNGHFLVIGMDNLRGVSPGIGIIELVHKVKRSNAAIIWAHPYRQDKDAPEPLDAADMPPGIHAVEVASSNMGGDETDLALTCAVRIGCAAVGGSDAHCLNQVGSAYTLFAHLPKDEKELAAAIRSGFCRAMHLRGGIIYSDGWPAAGRLQHVGFAHEPQQ